MSAHRTISVDALGGLRLVRVGPLPSFVIPHPPGMNFVSVVQPDDPSLIGVTLYAQALLVQHPTLFRLTNVTADQVVR